MRVTVAPRAETAGMALVVSTAKEMPVDKAERRMAVRDSLSAAAKWA